MFARARMLSVMTVIAVGALVGAATAPGHDAIASKRSSCHIPLSGLNSSPTDDTSPLDPGLLSRFNVFRRPASPSDALPPVNPFGLPLGFQLRSYFPAYIRQVAQLPNGRRFFVVPGFRKIIPLPPAHCVPRAKRHKLDELMRKQQGQAALPVYCLGTVGGQTSPFGDAICRGFDAIDSGATLVETALSLSAVGDLVPDGVATVRLTYRDGVVVTAPVSDNFLTFTPPQAPVKRALARTHQIVRLLNKNYDHPRRVTALLKQLAAVSNRVAPNKIEWLDASGHVVRSIKPRGTVVNRFTGSFFGTLG